MRFSMYQNVLALLSSASLTAASPLLANRANGLPLPAETIYQFNETGTWLENIAVLENGDLLMTMFWPEASVFTLKAPYSSAREFASVYTFEEGNGLVGIAITQPDTFVTISGQFTELAEPVPESWIAWEVSIMAPTPSVREITALPNMQFPNGVEPVHGREKEVILIADSRAGAAWRLDTMTGDYEMVLQVPEMAPLPNATLPLGINGIKMRGDGYMYWSNSNLVSVYRYPFDNNGYPVADGTVEKVGTIPAANLDDFTFDGAGTIWATTDFDNKLFVLSPDGSSELVLGGETDATLAGDTACVFGRAKQDSDILYVVTGGALALPINGTFTEPGKLVAVDTSIYSQDY